MVGELKVRRLPGLRWLRRPTKLPELPRTPRPTRLRNVTTWQLTAGAATVGLALSAVAVTAAGPWDSGQRTAERAAAVDSGRDGGTDHGDGREPSAAPSAPGVLTALGAPAGGAPAPTGGALADVLDPLLKDPSLGADRTASVVDAATGTEVYGAKAGDAVVPASTIKIATAVAALSALGPDHRIVTRTVIEPGATDSADPAKRADVALVGGGDPTLTARKGTQGNASLHTLADATAHALGDRGVDKIKLSYDSSAYAGPELHPIGPNENIAPVSALMADEGRLDDSTSGPAPRTAEPARDAARTFAGLLRDRGIDVKGEPGPTKAGDGAKTLGSTKSAPLDALVERMLTHSDNDIAEHLARQTALAAGEPASFDGAAKAVKKQLDKLELPVKKGKFADGSGLDRKDRVTSKLLTALLARAADPDHPELRPVLTGLPVAGFTGTLRSRYAAGGATAPGTGLVRAKTGTLTGVNTLAGTVVDADGRLLVFAFTGSGTGDAKAAQSTLDRLASTVANCGCR
ncbi:D-alanyl-D-alanine carboxypeptidase/D-alanyl-D-alanine endopeptidase [Streptomyces boluensis]|uniref:D-alanyl-D-alanine carboxypeptidase/D-alanyl-D-alanine-endopeptidase n=1 Tax=Streptomyces boluensis TaxID=1775135 RepID=A0A964UNW6_9ACTN|nr:D-alanyl-D-alanine carboxypeptidase/D-alanyl-D-alanine-endopeptidase [Streptomyces boluensis]NBE51268.1 D-alanyl-D-alanine carboxypeptidase/D-alanyl-D-alanine-endopeptidase [Streptomyces boluensis]